MIYLKYYLHGVLLIQQWYKFTNESKHIVRGGGLVRPLLVKSKEEESPQSDRLQRSLHNFKNIVLIYVLL